MHTTTGLEVVLTKIAKFGVNAVPYQAGDIRKVVGIVVSVRKSGVIYTKSLGGGSKHFILPEIAGFMHLFPRDPAGFLFQTR